jgi:hypothetical protein
MAITSLPRYIAIHTPFLKIFIYGKPAFNRKAGYFFAIFSGAI